MLEAFEAIWSELALLEETFHSCHTPGHWLPALLLHAAVMPPPTLT